MTNIEYNERLLRRKKLVLKRTAIKGLAAIGLPALIMVGISQTHQFNPTGVAPISAQYEDYKTVELADNIKPIIDKLKVYDDARDNYNEVVSIKNIDEKYLIEARKDMIKNAYTLEDIFEDVVRVKVIDSLNLSDETTITINDVSSSAEVDYMILANDGDDTYIITDLPGKIIKGANLCARLNSFSGDGSSKAWDDGIKTYEEISDELFNNILVVATGDNYKFDVSKVEGSKSR